MAKLLKETIEAIDGPTLDVFVLVRSDRDSPSHEEVIQVYLNESAARTHFRLLEVKGEPKHPGAQYFYDRYTAHSKLELKPHFGAAPHWPELPDEGSALAGLES